MDLLEQVQGDQRITQVAGSRLDRLAGPRGSLHMLDRPVSDCHGRTTEHIAWRRADQCDWTS